MFSVNLSRYQELIPQLTRRNDVVLAVFLATIVVMMVLPMPTVVVDILVAINISIAIVLMMIGVYLSSPLKFSSFPTVLLLTTLFRLALSITTTRLILLQADAGNIITTFGDFVVGGNLVVGIVVFLIITLVQFIVITKGSERVAEVAARFSLDGMPGKQMSIDGDLRAGTIDTEQASQRRKLLEKESQLYGSMDGAMKFVKGDAIAGIFIILINIIGGISVGTLQQDMDLGDALRIYTILTIGDGLVTQIPALFIAITSGIMVTRVTSGKNKNLGQEIGDQVFAQPKALLVGSVVIFAFALVPGFPSATFIFIALLLGFIGFVLLASNRQAKQQSGESFQRTNISEIVDEGELLDADNRQIIAAPLAVEFSMNLSEEIKDSYLKKDINALKKSFEKKLGIPFPDIVIRYTSQDQESNYSILLNEIPVKEAVFESNKQLINDIDELLHQNLEEFINIQQASFLIEKLKQSSADLVREVQSAISLPTISLILKSLVTEGLPIRDLQTILEAMVRKAKETHDPQLITEAVRLSVSRQIAYTFGGIEKVINAMLFDTDVEAAFYSQVPAEENAEVLPLPEGFQKAVINKVNTILSDWDSTKKAPVIIVSSEVRRFVMGMLKSHNCGIRVLAYEEITGDIHIDIIDTVQFHADNLS